MAKLSALVALPPGPCTYILPTTAVEATVNVIVLSFTILKLPTDVPPLPPYLTMVAPVNPLPLMVTVLPT